MRLSLVIALLVCFSPAAIAAQDPFAVVELFTSEGCSSCPPADLLLSKLDAGARQKDLRIFPLSIHVDYWNRLGWRDPFSQKQFTQRQLVYDRVLAAGSVATPQFIINGTKYVFGAEESKLEGLVNKALNEPASSSLDLAVLGVKEDRLRLSYHYQGSLNDKDLQLVLVERTVQIDVASGENSGRKLRHDNVVRSWQHMPIKDAKGSLELVYAHAKPWDDFELIAFVQDRSSLEITAACRAEIPRR